MKYLLTLVLLLGCQKNPAIIVVEGPEESCSIVEVEGGAIIECPDGSTAVILDGEAGEDGEAGIDSIIEIIDPCGPSGGFDEILLRLSDNRLLAYFEDGEGNRHLVIIPPGTYRTTDAQRCLFKVTEDMEVIEL